MEKGRNGREKGDAVAEQSVANRQNGDSGGCAARLRASL